MLPGPAARLLGERGAVLVGIACASAGLTVMAFAGQGWIIFSIMPVFALGGIGTPALQALGVDPMDYLRRASPLQYVWHAAKRPRGAFAVSSSACWRE